jgi:hypothetical protein
LNTEKRQAQEEGVIVVRGLMPLGLPGYNLHTEKDNEIMSKYRSIKKHDRTVSVPDDGNENMIIVSQIQKNDRFRTV